MAFDIAVTSKDFAGNEDRRWLGTRQGVTVCRSVTLDVSTFDPQHFVAKGAIPSGILLGRITATGLYGPYGSRATEVQTLTRTSTGGTVTLSYDGAGPTATIPATAAGFTAAAVLAALVALPNLNANDITVSGPAGGPIVITFSGERFIGAENVPAITVDNTGATGGTITNATTTGGGSAVSDGREIATGFLFNTTMVGRVGDGSDYATAPDVGVPMYWGPGIIKVSKLPTFGGGVTAGTLDAAARNDLRHFIRFEA